MTLSLVTEARETILAQLAAVMIQAELPAWRVSKYPPRQVASPGVWIDLPALSYGELGVEASFPVVFVVDGDQWSQVSQLDLALAFLWDAVSQVDGMAATDATPVMRDVGGPASRTVQLSVTVALGFSGLCREVASLSDAVPALT